MLRYATKTEGKGSGLGFPIARTMIERWGGNIHIANIENQGALVRATLPIVE